jgi:hypothetical protein
MKRTILLTIMAMDLALATNFHSVSPLSSKQESPLVQLTQGPTKKMVPDDFASGKTGSQSKLKGENDRKTAPVLIAPNCSSCRPRIFQDWIQQLKFALFWL